MIVPNHGAVDIDEMRQWALGYKNADGLSWEKFGHRCGVPGGTLQPFCMGNYAGNNGRVAAEIFKFRQSAQMSEDRSIGIPVDPGYFETPTSQAINALLVIAQLGRITVGATSPGLGKTLTAEHYQACNSNVWVATMKESTRSLNQMIWEVSKAIGEPSRGGNWSASASRDIAEKVRGRRGLIVIDEANKLSLEAIEEIRSWHDETKVGICLLGNEELMMRIEAGRTRDALARLKSRIAQSRVQTLPVEGDIVAFCDAWAIEDPGMRKLLVDVALRPGSGGLRECRMIVESGSILAMDDGRPLTLADLRDALSMRATRLVRS